MINDPVHSLTFGDLVWVEEGANPPDSSGVVYRVRAQDATFGTAVPVTVALLWLGRAGGPVSYDSTPNREPVFRVTVEADDSDLLARGEMALQLQCEQPTLLTWTPPDGAGEPSVFEVVWSHLEPVFERDGLTGVGMEETVLRTRTYLVRMQALPYARGEDLVVTPAVPVTPTYTLVDDGSSLGGWITNNFFTRSIDAGRVKMTRSSGTGREGILYRTGTFATNAYLVLDILLSGLIPYGPGLQVSTSGIPLNVTTTVDLGGGLTRYFYSIPPSLTAVAEIRISMYSVSNWSTGALYVDQVQTSNAIPFIGTARQKVMSLVPGGSVRAEGSVHVEHATSPLGKAIVYTHPSGTGYLPPLRVWRTSGNTETTDSSLLSGKREPIGPSSTVFRVPVTNLPTGRVELWAWLRVTTGSLTRAPAYAIRSVVNGVVLSTAGGSFPITFTTVNVWQLFCLGALTSPPIGMGPSGLVQIDLNENSGEVQLDEAYLFATDQGSLTVIDCGTGTASAGGPSRHLWIDAPSPDVPMGAIYRGHSSDRSDAFHAGSVTYSDTWGVHDFDPTGTSVFVATSNALDASTSLEHYRRYNTFVSRED